MITGALWAVSLGLPHWLGMSAVGRAGGGHIM